MPDKKLIKDSYLGDSVYASFDGYCILLDLRGQDSTTRIALEPAVFNALLKYKAAVDLLQNTAKPTCTDCEDFGEVVDLKGHHVCTKANADPRDRRSTPTEPAKEEGPLLFDPLSVNTPSEKLCPECKGYGFTGEHPKECPMCKGTGAQAVPRAE